MGKEKLKRKHDDVIDWTPCLRQILISSGVCANSFMFGLNMGAPTVIIPQIRRQTNNTDAVNIHMESWLSSILGFSGIPWVFILAVLAYSIGRKKTCFIVSLSAAIGFIVFYWGSSIKYVLISQVIQGPLAGGHVCTAFMISSEYFSPQYRAIVFTFLTATLFWGIWVSNAIGTFTHWENIGLLGLICSIYSLVNVILWPESPYWLALKGRFEECISSHKWLKGTSVGSENELESLLLIDVEKKTSRFKFSLIRDHTRSFFNVLLLPEVYKALSLCALCITMFHFTGKVVCTMYSIKIIKKITSSESAAYTGMLILDGVTVFGMYSGSILMKHLKRRSFFLVSSFIAVILLLANSIYLYLIKLSIISENAYVSIGLLSILFLVISVGPMILSPAINGELIPLKSRNVCVCLSAFYAKTTMSLMLKLTPYVFRLIDFHGTFLVFAIACSICLLLAFKYLPETKNKTLIEISEIFMDPSKSNIEAKELMPLKLEETI